MRRMEENRIPRMAMTCNPTCKNKRGRPRRTWFGGIRDAMEKRGIEKAWILDRPRWREVL